MIYKFRDNGNQIWYVLGTNPILAKKQLEKDLKVKVALEQSHDISDLRKHITLYNRNFDFK